MINLQEARVRIQNDKDWQSRALYIEVFHSEMMLSRKKWSVRRTAKILGMCASTICEDLMISKYSASDSEVSKKRTRTEAIKYVRSVK